jgi:phosphoribosylaminoimidazole-succinocarboxamide synthase
VSTAEQKKLKLAYEGSVKRVWQCPWDESSLLFEFTDDYSIFDWGKMPDTIANKGRALAVFGTFFFDRLADPSFWQGLNKSNTLEKFENEFAVELKKSPVLQELLKAGLESHFQGLVSETGEKLSLEKAAAHPHPIYMQVRKATVQRPKPVVVLNQNVFDYPQADHSLRTRLIPLEVVFRFGMPSGSSLKERLEKNPAYARTLGLSKQPVEGQMFERPVLEFYTKLEPKDRLLSAQEALLISGLDGAQFNELVDRTLFACIALFWQFQQRGIELWDGKFEFIMHEGKILLADSIGPDELRLLYKETHLSKEMIRQIYRGSNWERSLKEAQKLAQERCTLEWKAICKDELHSSPATFSAENKEIVDALYGVLANNVTGETLFKSHPGLDEFVSSTKNLKRTD